MDADGSNLTRLTEDEAYDFALVTLDPEALARWRGAQGRSATHYAALEADSAVRACVGSCVDVLNSRLNRWETIKDSRSSTTTSLSTTAS